MAETGARADVTRHGAGGDGQAWRRWRM